MQQVDERILEHLEAETWSTPRLMARDRHFEDMDVSQAHIEERCEELMARELVAPFREDSDMYEITTWGRLYLDGDLDADNLPRFSVG